MNWKAEAEEKLRRYDAMRRAADNLTAEIAMLESAAGGVKGADWSRVGSKGGVSRREDALLNNIVKRQEMQWSLDQTRRWLQIVNRALDALGREERLVLTQFYIHPERGGAEKLSTELGLEQSSIYRRRNVALRKFTLALYGAEESLRPSHFS